MQAYCFKCRTKTEMKDAKAVTLNSKRAARGICSKCGTKVIKHSS